MQKVCNLLATALIGVLLSGVSAYADKLDDFKSAAEAEGCNSIPYSDLRSNCQGQQQYVHDWCDGNRGPVSCEQSVTGRIRTNLADEHRKYDQLREDKAGLEDAINKASDDAEKEKLTKELEEKNEALSESEKEINDLNEELKTRDETVAKTIETIEKCIAYRTAVMNVFAAALDQVRNENEPGIESYVETLRDKYEASKSGHAIAISDRDNAVSACKDKRAPY